MSTPHEVREGFLETDGLPRPNSDHPYGRERTESDAQSSALRRELARREGDGLDVALYWEPEEDKTTLIVVDKRFDGESFQMEVPAARALDAFYHPFAYARDLGGSALAA